MLKIVHVCDLLMELEILCKPDTNLDFWDTLDFWCQVIIISTPERVVIKSEGPYIDNTIEVNGRSNYVTTHKQELYNAP